MRTSGRLRAPADRPVGSRGVRAPVAAVAAIAAVVTLRFAEVVDDPAWTRVPLLLAAAALVAASVLIWVARRPAGLVSAAALLVLAVGAWVVAEAAQRSAEREASKWGGADFKFDDRGPVISRAEAEAVPKGATKDEVRAILGPAAGSGIQRVNDGKDLRCVVYRAAEGRGPNRVLYAFCFTGERYSDLHEW